MDTCRSYRSPHRRRHPYRRCRPARHHWCRSADPRVADTCRSYRSPRRRRRPDRRNRPGCLHPCSRIPRQWMNCNCRPRHYMLRTLQDGSPHSCRCSRCWWPRRQWVARSVRDRRQPRSHRRRHRCSTSSHPQRSCRRRRPRRRSPRRRRRDRTLPSHRDESTGSLSGNHRRPARRRYRHRRRHSRVRCRCRYRASGSPRSVDSSRTATRAHRSDRRCRHQDPWYRAGRPHRYRESAAPA